MAFRMRYDISIPVCKNTKDHFFSLESKILWFQLSLMYKFDNYNFQKFKMTYHGHFYPWKTYITHIFRV